MDKTAIPYLDLSANYSWSGFHTFDKDVDLLPLTLEDTSGSHWRFRLRTTLEPSALSSLTDFGVQSITNIKGANDITGECFAGQFGFLNTNTGTIERITGVEAGPANFSSGTITDAFGVRAFINNINVSGVITNAYALYAATQGNGTNTNAYGLYIDTLVGTNKWGIFQAGPELNQFGGNLQSAGSIKSISPTEGIGYGTGAGSNVSQLTSRTTGVTINKVCGRISLFTSANSTTYRSFTVTNSTVSQNDTIIVCQKAGAGLHKIHVTGVFDGSFIISTATISDTSVATPVFNFTVIKSVAS